MKIHYLSDLTSLPDFGILATIGFFDGVHTGHRFLINQVKKAAAERGLSSAVITFPVHPRKLLRQDYQPELLNSPEEKLKLLATTGIEHCIVLDFTAELAALSAESFIRNKLAAELKVKALIIGYDHRFGKDRKDGFEEYKIYGKSCGIEVIQTQALQQTTYHISSTSIRNLLQEGRIKEANMLLGYSYSIEGIIIEGNKLGRTIGFPTANLELNEKQKLTPRNGVYAVQVTFATRRYPAMAYIGFRPTVCSGKEKRIEINLFHFSGDLYGKIFQVEFEHFIRDDRKFASVEDLKNQLSADRNESLRYFDGV